jgi:hypothetical protein
MGNPESEGLGLSVLVYMAALTGTLAVLAVPAYFATRPVVYANPPLARSDPLRGPIVGARLDTPFPLARLERATLVDPTIAAGLSARAKKAEPEHRVTHRVARRPTGTPIAELQPERKRPTFSLFGLFGG